MCEIVKLGRGWLYYIASAHIMVNVVEEIYQCWNKKWIVFYVKFVLSTKKYDDDDDDDDGDKLYFSVRSSSWPCTAYL